MNRDSNVIVLFVLPLILLLFLFVFLPVLGTFWISFFKDVTFLPRRFVFLGNYIHLLGDAQFWQALRFTLLFSFVSVTVELVLGLIVALVINEYFKFRGAIRGIVLIPWVIPSIIAARLWQLIYQYDYGILNYIFGKLLGLHVNFLGSAGMAFLSLVIADVWRSTPFVAIILLAGLQVIPKEIYRQAKVDGAGIFQRLLRITLPLIRPVMVVALLFRTIDALRVFDIIYVITGGAPGGATTSVSLYGYRYFLMGDFGYGSCVSFVLFLVAFGISLCYLKLSRFQREPM